MSSSHSIDDLSFAAFETAINNCPTNEFDSDGHPIINPSIQAFLVKWANLRDEQGNTILHHAARLKRIDIAHEILKYNQDIDISANKLISVRNNFGISPLLIAYQREDSLMMGLFTKADAVKIFISLKKTEAEIIKAIEDNDDRLLSNFFSSTAENYWQEYAKIYDINVSHALPSSLIKCAVIGNNSPLLRILITHYTKETDTIKKYDFVQKIIIFGSLAQIKKIFFQADETTPTEINQTIPLVIIVASIYFLLMNEPDNFEKIAAILTLFSNTQKNLVPLIMLQLLTKNEPPKSPLEQLTQAARDMAFERIVAHFAIFAEEAIMGIIDHPTFGEFLLQCELEKVVLLISYVPMDKKNTIVKNFFRQLYLDVNDIDILRQGIHDAAKLELLPLFDNYMVEKSLHKFCMEKEYEEILKLFISAGLSISSDLVHICYYSDPPIPREKVSIMVKLAHQQLHDAISSPLTVNTDIPNALYDVIHQYNTLSPKQFEYHWDNGDLEKDIRKNLDNIPKIDEILRKFYEKYPPSETYPVSLYQLEDSSLIALRSEYYRKEIIKEMNFSAEEVYDFIEFEIPSCKSLPETIAIDTIFHLFNRAKDLRILEQIFSQSTILEVMARTKQVAILIQEGFALTLAMIPTLLAKYSKKEIHDLFTLANEKQKEIAEKHNAIASNLYTPTQGSYYIDHFEFANKLNACQHIAEIRQLLSNLFNNYAPEQYPTSLITQVDPNYFTSLIQTIVNKFATSKDPYETIDLFHWLLEIKAISHNDIPIFKSVLANQTALPSAHKEAYTKWINHLSSPDSHHASSYSRRGPMLFTPPPVVPGLPPIISVSAEGPTTLSNR